MSNQAEHILTMNLAPSRNQPLSFQYLARVKDKDGTLMIEYVDDNWNLQKVRATDYNESTHRHKYSKVAFGTPLTITFKATGQDSVDSKKEKVCEWLMNVHPQVINLDNPVIDQKKVDANYKDGDRFPASYSKTKAESTYNITLIRHQAIDIFLKYTLNQQIATCMFFLQNIKGFTRKRIVELMCHIDSSERLVKDVDGQNGATVKRATHIEKGILWIGENAAKLVEYNRNIESNELDVNVKKGLIIGAIKFETGVGYRFPKEGDGISTPDLNRLASWLRDNPMMYERLITENAQEDFGIYDDISPENDLTIPKDKKQPPAQKHKAEILSDTL